MSGDPDAREASGGATRWREAAERPGSLPAALRRGLRHGALSASAALADARRAWRRSAGRLASGTGGTDEVGGGGGVGDGTGAAGGGGEPVLRLLYCHYVFDDQVRAFERILRELQRLGRFVTTAEALDVLHGRRALDGPAFHLSFDDGFANVASNAAPLMRRLGVPAAFFVPSAIVGADAARVREYCLETTRYAAVVDVASWDQLRAMADAGFDIGSHTRTHARFSEMSASPERLRDELEGSKADIERELGGPCRYISWPYGQAGDADARSLGAVRRAGYEACFSASRGHVRSGVGDPWRVPRHHFEPQWPLSHVRHFALGAREPAVPG